MRGGERVKSRNGVRGERKKETEEWLMREYRGERKGGGKDKEGKLAKETKRMKGEAKL